jgi:hypothetical protein
MKIGIKVIHGNYGRRVNNKVIEINNKAYKM